MAGIHRFHFPLVASHWSTKAVHYSKTYSIDAFPLHHKRIEVLRLQGISDMISVCDQDNPNWLIASSFLAASSPERMLSHKASSWKRYGARDDGFLYKIWAPQILKITAALEISDFIAKSYDSKWKMQEVFFKMNTVLQYVGDSA